MHMAFEFPEKHNQFWFGCVKTLKTAAYCAGLGSKCIWTACEARFCSASQGPGKWQPDCVVEDYSNTMLKTWRLTFTQIAYYRCTNGLVAAVAQPMELLMTGLSAI